jgi:hypothetical protein
VLEDGKDVHYDLVAKKVVTFVEDWGKEDTLKLTGGKLEPIEAPKPTGNFNAMISREDAVPTVTKTKSTTKKTGGKKTSSKKAIK